jgi:hypothetical protein
MHFYLLKKSDKVVVALSWETGTKALLSAISTLCEKIKAVDNL